MKYKNERFYFDDIKQENFSQCLECEHWKYATGAYCKAFPVGIPWIILTNEHDHKEPYPGDQGITFKQKRKG